MSKKTEYVVVITSVDGEGEAGRLAGLIVAEKLAACVQYNTINSTYRWKGNVVMNEECRLQCKTRADLADALMAFIKKNHTYEVPELIVMPISGGYEAYLNWIAAETRD